MTSGSESDTSYSSDEETSTLNIGSVGNPIPIADDGTYDEATDCWAHVDNIQLKGEEEGILKSKDMWLNDEIINASQSLLKKAFPAMGGMQDTLLQKNHQFLIESGEFIQIINKGNCHWILLPNIGMKNLSTVRVLDSLNSTFLSLEVQKIIASIIHPSSSEVTVKFDDVAPQRDQNSCGLLAIAFATSLCHGNDPRKYQFDVPIMRQHLY